jgi:hypothetical protein
VVDLNRAKEASYLDFRWVEAMAAMQFGTLVSIQLGVAYLQMKTVFLGQPVAVWVIAVVAT